MSVDIFEFWSKVSPGDTQHPQDRDVLLRMGDGAHGFDLLCLPSCFMGPLRSAPVVLLYSSQGIDPSDLSEAKTDNGRERIHRQRKGTQPLPSDIEHKSSWKWWSKQTKCFGDWKELRDKIAILDICAYHSKTIKNYAVLAALPSSRASLEWAQTVLFPEAIAGERIVICLRATRYWGLDAGMEGNKYGESLYAPHVTQGGAMKNGAMRDEIIRKVARTIHRGPVRGFS